MDQFEKSDAERKERPGCGCFLVILAGVMAMYLLHIAVPGRSEGVNHWIDASRLG